MYSLTCSSGRADSGIEGASTLTIPQWTKALLGFPAVTPVSQADVTAVSSPEPISGSRSLRWYLRSKELDRSV
jgi:hypothetical protein